MIQKINWWHVLLQAYSLRCKTCFINLILALSHKHVKEPYWSCNISTWTLINGPPTNDLTTWWSRRDQNIYMTRYNNDIQCRTTKQKQVHGTKNSCNRPSQPNALCCITCGERGHLLTACPTYGRRSLLASDKDVVGDPIYDDYGEQIDDVEEEQVDGDTDTLLMLRRNCLAPKASEEWQGCPCSAPLVRWKVCRFVVDSGCSENVVSEEAVHKLALIPETHAHPYRLLWMQTGACVFVSQRALFSLSIGSF